MKDTVASEIKVTGVIKDAKDSLALAGAMVKYGSKSVASNTDGYFEIMVPANATELLVAFVGYERTTLKLDLQHKQVYDVYLKAAIFTLGEVIIVPVKKKN
jgi:hypothetical protein